MSEEIFQDKASALRWLHEQGWQVADSTFYYHINTRKLLKVRKDGTIARKALERYAKRELTKEGEPVKDKDDAGAHEKRAEAQAQAYEADAKLKAVRLAKLEGRVVERSVVEDELATRARVFRIGLESWGPKAAAEVAELFGAGEASARQLIEAAGGDIGRVGAVQSFVEGILPDFIALWRGAIEGFLEPFATGAWWTEEMAAAWDQAEQGHQEG